MPKKHNVLTDHLIEIKSRGAPANSGKHCEFIADRDYIVRSIKYRFEVGGGVSTATAVIYKAPSGTTLDAGTALHSGVIDLTASGGNGGPTASITGTATLSTTAGATYIPKGYAIGIVFGADMSSLLGTCIVVELEAV